MVVDFILECTILDIDALEEVRPFDAPLRDAWELHVDWSSSIPRSVVGIILTILDGIVIEYALCFKFLISNKEAEYEALLVGICLVKEF